MVEMPYFSQERTKPYQIFPFPEEGRIVEENPPCLSWVLLDHETMYTVVLKDAEGKEIWRGETTKNYIVPPILPGAGEYRWNIYADGMQRGEQRFMLAEKFVEIHRVSAEVLYANVPDVRPRHLFFAEDIPDLLEKKAATVEVFRRNIEEAYVNGFPERPMYHRDKNALPYREYFGRFRDYCDRDLVACSLGYALLQDKKAGEHAKKLLLTICDWNPEGPCSINGRWGDEVGLSCARCLPSVFDLLYPLLDEREIDYVARTIRVYAQQCWERMKRLDYCANPGESHAGRLPAYLGEAAMVLKGTGVQTEEEAIRWLDYALDIYGGIFPYFGTPDGGWAEGTFYATSYTKWYLPFFSAVERYGGCRFLDRPFYQRLTQFFLHFASPEFEIHPFGDGYWCAPADAEWPGFFAQNPCSLYAERFGPELARERSRQAVSQPLYLLHLLDLFLPEGTSPGVSLTGEMSEVQAFLDAGFISMHMDLAHAKQDFALLARASKFGSDSHRHADQGSFALFYGGKVLISPSGYFGRQYGSKHHFQWLKTTKAHNTILVDGEGQPESSMLSTGKILSCEEKDGIKKAVLDISEAYASLQSFQRTFTLMEDRLLVEDEIEAREPVVITYPLHSLSRPVEENGEVIVERGEVRLHIRLMEGELGECEISDRYEVDLNEGEPEEYHVTMPQQYHMQWKTPRKKTHRIVVEYEIEKI